MASHLLPSFRDLHLLLGVDRFGNLGRKVLIFLIIGNGKNLYGSTFGFFLHFAFDLELLLEVLLVDIIKIANQVVHVPLVDYKPTSLKLF